MSDKPADQGGGPAKKSSNKGVIIFIVILGLLFLYPDAASNTASQIERLLLIPVTIISSLLGVLQRNAETIIRIVVVILLIRWVMGKNK